MPRRPLLREILPGIPLYPRGARRPVYVSTPSAAARATGRHRSYWSRLWGSPDRPTRPPWPVTPRLALELSRLTRGAYPVDFFLGLNPEAYPADKTRWPGGREYARRQARKSRRRR
mgnify:FL=1